MVTVHVRVMLCFCGLPLQVDTIYCCTALYKSMILVNRSRETQKKRIWHNHSKHDDVIRLKHFPRYWPFVWGIPRSPLNSPHKGQWRGALVFSLIFAWINGWVNNRDAGDLRRHRAHYDVIVMVKHIETTCIPMIYRVIYLAATVGDHCVTLVWHKLFRRSFASTI